MLHPQLAGILGISATAGAKALSHTVSFAMILVRDIMLNGGSASNATPSFTLRALQLTALSGCRPSSRTSASTRIGAPSIAREISSSLHVVALVATPQQLHLSCASSTRRHHLVGAVQEGCTAAVCLTLRMRSQGKHLAPPGADDPAAAGSSPRGGGPPASCPARFVLVFGVSRPPFRS